MLPLSSPLFSRHHNKVLALLQDRFQIELAMPLVCLGKAGMAEAFSSPAGLSYLSTLRKFADLASTWPEAHVLRQLQFNFCTDLFDEASELDADSTLRSAFLTRLLHFLPTLIRCA